MWKEQYKKNREYLIKKSTDSTRIRRQQEGVKEKNRADSREAKRKLLLDPVKREMHRKQVRDWFKNNKARVNEYPSRSKAIRAHYTSLYNATILMATPKWADLKAISEFYREAARLTAETGVPHEVDHIVPLRYKAASGLHVPANLQVITRAENRSKSNRFINF